MKNKARQIPKSERTNEIIGAGVFKAKCLHILDEVNRTRKSILITKRGRPVARLLPAGDSKPKAIGGMEGTVEFLGHIVAPIDVTWEGFAESDQAPIGARV